MLDLETLKSDLVVADIDGSTEEVWPSTSWKGFLGWTLAAIAAIVAGVIPALWINRWRGEADAAAAPIVDQQVAPIEAAPPPKQEPSVEPIEVAPPPVAIAEPTKAAATVKKPTRRPKVKQPVRVPKKAPPTCNIYLHPHGCPK